MWEILGNETNKKGKKVFGRTHDCFWCEMMWGYKITCRNFGGKLCGKWVWGIGVQAGLMSSTWLVGIGFRSGQVLGGRQKVDSF